MEIEWHRMAYSRNPMNTLYIRNEHEIILQQIFNHTLKITMFKNVLKEQLNIFPQKCLLQLKTV